WSVPDSGPGQPARKPRRTACLGRYAQPGKRDGRGGEDCGRRIRTESPSPPRRAPAVEFSAGTGHSAPQPRSRQDQILIRGAPHKKRLMKVWYNKIHDSRRTMVEVAESLITIGRDSANTIVLQSPLVSKKHAVITQKNGTLRLENVGINGCMVGDVEVLGGQ